MANIVAHKKHKRRKSPKYDLSKPEHVEAKRKRDEYNDWQLFKKYYKRSLNKLAKLELLYLQPLSLVGDDYFDLLMHVANDLRNHGCVTDEELERARFCTGKIKLEYDLSKYKMDKKWSTNWKRSTLG